MKFSLNLGEWNSVFAVPASVVDQYIKLASGNSLKLLMFLLRHGGEAFSDDVLKSELGFSETGELEDAALFWIQRGIIRYSKEEGGELSPASLQKAVPQKTVLHTEERTVSENPPAEQLTIEEAPKSIETAAAKPKLAPASVSSGEIAARMRQDKEIEFLFHEAEALYARPLRQRDNQTIISLVDHFGLPAGVALMLLKYCFGAGKSSPSYINAVAQDWSDEGVDSIELADAKIRSLEKQNGAEARLREALEMTTAFSPQQKKLIKIWSEDWGFSEEMILLACNKTVDQLGKWKSSYTNKILENWKSDNIFTPDAANSEKQPVKTATGPSAASSFDMDDVMSKIINRYKK
ncbi:MAG: DnaD domain protein [Oscillospiraceae bacterium]|nr:DnaD domain protein [Oscillospiraceae bacterium]